MNLSVEVISHLEKSGDLLARKASIDEHMETLRSA